MGESGPVALCVQSHLRYFRAFGYFRKRDSPYSKSAQAHAIFRVIVFVVNGVYLLQHCVKAYQERTDIDKLARPTFLMLVQLTFLAKQLVFLCDAPRVDQLLDLLDDAVLSPQTAEAHALLLSGATHARRLHVVFCSDAALTALLWMVISWLSYSQGQTVEIPFWYPQAPRTDRMFVAVTLYAFSMTTLAGTGDTTMDAFVGTILLQCKMQFVILRRKYETLIDRATEQWERSGGDRHEITMELFVECVQHQNKIYEMAELLQDLFNGALLLQFGVGGLILCMIAYKMVGMSLLGVEFLSMCFFLTCILIELFVYCYYGNEVTFESKRLAEGIYATAWQEADLRMRRALLLAVVRAQRPLQLVAGRFVPLSLDTFFKILKTSYSIYAVLRQTK